MEFCTNNFLTFFQGWSLMQSICFCWQFLQVSIIYLKYIGTNTQLLTVYQELFFWYILASKFQNIKKLLYVEWQCININGNQCHHWHIAILQKSWYFLHYGIRKVFWNPLRVGRLWLQNHIIRGRRTGWEDE